MNNKIKMKIISNDNIKMKLTDNEKINMDMNVGGKEVDPIFRNSPAYKITNEDITYWNNKSNFSGNYDDLKNKPIIPNRTSELINDSGFITKSVSNLENYTLSTNLATVATTGLYSDLLEKPTIPTDTSDLTNNAGFVTSDTSSLENYTLTSNLATVATTGSYSDLLNTPTLANVATSGQYSDLLNKPTLATVASTGDYDDLINKPSIPVVPSDISAFNNDVGYITNTVNDLTNYTLSSNLATVATTGDYNDLLDKPTIPSKTSELTNDSDFTNKTYVDGFMKATKIFSGNVYQTGVPSSLDENLVNLKLYIIEVKGLSSGALEYIPFVSNGGTQTVQHTMYDGTTTVRWRLDFTSSSFTLSTSCINMGTNTGVQAIYRIN